MHENQINTKTRSENKQESIFPNKTSIKLFCVAMTTENILTWQPSMFFVWFGKREIFVLILTKGFVYIIDHVGECGEATGNLLKDSAE